MKEVSRRNGVAGSDQASIMTMRFTRHGDVLTLLAISDDPVYLAEPVVRTWNNALGATHTPYVGPPCLVTFEGTEFGTVPQISPVKGPGLDELTVECGVGRRPTL